MQSAWVQSSIVQWFLKTCAVAKKKLEDFDDRCIRLIELFGGYSVSEVLHTRVAGRMHGVACRMHGLACCMYGVAYRMQGHSFLVEREC